MSPDKEASAATRTAQEEPRTPLPWPPPGLEHLHGTLWPTLTLLGVGGVLMAAPTLLTIGVQPPFWSPGLFGSLSWLVGVTSLAGLSLVLVALVRACLALRRAARGVKSGYDGRTLLYVACDATRDGGFLMQGLRQYASLDERERKWLLDVRASAALAYAAGLLWIPVAFTIGLLLATRGLVRDPRLLLPLIALPASLLLVAGLCARGFDGLVTRRALAAWRKAGSGDRDSRLEAEAWMRARAVRSGERYARARAGRTLVPQLSALGVGGMALLLPLPILLLSLLGTAGPLIARAWSPRFTATAGRVVRTQLLQPYSLPPDRSITPTDAGETIQALAFVGRPGTHQAPIERAPVREYVDPWLPAGRPESLGPLEILVPRVLDGRKSLTSDERAWLVRAARHPAQAEVTRLARATDADIVTTRWDTSTFAHASMDNLPLLRFGAFREGVSVHLAMGLLAAERGDREAAETMFREVISLGLLLVRSGPTLIETLVGTSLALYGADALRAFYESTGRTADANSIRFALEGAERAEAMTKSLQPLLDSHGTLRGMMAVAGNPDLPRSLRWASLMSARQSASCLSTNTVLFGHDAEYDEWLEQMHASLVRFPSDDALFRIQENDPPPGDGRSSRHVNAIRRLLRFTFGDNGPAGSCAGLATVVTRLY